MKSNKKRKLFSIKIFISMAFNFVVIITGLLLCIFVFVFVRHVLRDNLYTRLNDLAYTISKNIDGDKFEKVISKEDPQSVEYYKSIQTKLQDIQKNTTDIFYIYSMRLNDKNQNVFVVPTDDDRGFMNWLNVPYLELAPEALQLHKKKGLVVVKSFIHDQYGTWVSGYCSILNSKGDVVGVVGVDVSAEKVIRSEMQCLAILIIITIVIVFIVILLGNYLSKMITRPLLNLQEEVAMIQRFELDDIIPSGTIFTEIYDMENVVDRTKKALRSFKRYVPAELVHQIVTTKKEAVLSGDKTQATFMFTDIKGFTTIAESMDISELVDKLGNYFQVMTSTIHSNSGTVDKYIGDAVMAFWGAPNYMENHASLACRSAVQCCNSLKIMNAELERGGFMPLNTRFGIHTGDAIIGNMGYSERLNYTAIGDTVNLASRLEGINKFYDTNIIISNDTFEIVKDEFVTRMLEKIIVKGKTSWITIHELLGKKGETDPQVVDFSGLFNSGMDLFYKGQWENAKRIFDDALKLKNMDRQCLRMISRCVKYMQDAPSDSWQGVVKLNSK